MRESKPVPAKRARWVTVRDAAHDRPPSPDRPAQPETRMPDRGSDPRLPS